MGFSFGEMVILAIVALVVVGPKDLPRILRAAGRLIGQAKRVVADVRRETGLDEVLRGDFQDLERLADHIEKLEPYRGDVTPQMLDGVLHVHREREYPTLGADAQGLLPDDAPVYMDAPAFATEDLPAPADAPVPAEPPAASHVDPPRHSEAAS